MEQVDRRDFLGAVVAGAGLAVLGGCSGGPKDQGPGGEDALAAGKSRVIRCRRANAVTDGDQVRSAVAKRMVDLVVRKLVRADSPENAWKALFNPSDVVAVKVNTCHGRGACTHREVCDAVVAGLLTAGVLADNITIYDRGEGNLKKSGYPLSPGPGVRTEGSTWEPEPTTNGAFHGQLATEIARPETTALVNLPILKNHGAKGVTLALKNHFGSISNPADHHGNDSDPALPDLNLVPAIRDKTRLIVADVLRPVGDGGPRATPAATWSYGGIMASLDPVAIDMIGCQILDEWRAAHGLAAVTPKAHYLQTAAAKGLGIADLAQIAVVDI